MFHQYHMHAAGSDPTESMGSSLGVGKFEFELDYALPLELVEQVKR
jgi:hypothetical protein